MPNQIEAVSQGVELPIAVVIGGFFAIACYNCIEIYILTFGTFRRKNTLYVWSMMAANTGIILHEISATLRLFKLTPNLPMVVTASLGWWMMTTGQSVVLYSRLYLVMNDTRKIRWVLIMITTTFLTLQLPTTVTFIGVNATPNNYPDRFTGPFDIFKIIQLAAFTVQETFLSGLYVYAFRKTSEPMRAIRGNKIRNMLRQMIALFLLVFALDTILMVTEYTGHFQIQTTLKPAVYSIKLKVELFVLNNLVNLVRSPTSSLWSSPINPIPSQQDQKDRSSARQAATFMGALQNGPSRSREVSIDLREHSSRNLDGTSLSPPITIIRSRTG
ncbi:uncharacterized protein F4822DRAFT_432095 [Hypoxylon trugodes]|uniref:uncharacterized protein n=1 Tax=Hypoxylon trugodes TaxID=326681 RepID=UPI00219EB970|nr:uncharacterized protein F4822DRAFT_432095 [Hypoxylon trugodes]KAI1385246.1 hypothetical protein F4822DRAFT_432095 [Hypoxylon trugodes]